MFRSKYKALRKTTRRNITRRLTVGLALAYAFFLLFPHFDAVTHVHAEDGSTHRHGFRSAHDVALERATLAEIPQAVPRGELAHTETPPEFSSPSFAVANGGKGGKSWTTSHGRAHTHFQEDPNLPAIGVDPATAAHVLGALAAPGTVPTFLPALAAQASPARAPPRA